MAGLLNMQFCQIWDAGMGEKTICRHAVSWLI